MRPRGQREVGDFELLTKGQIAPEVDGKALGLAFQLGVYWQSENLNGRRRYAFASSGKGKSLIVKRIQQALPASGAGRFLGINNAACHVESFRIERGRASMKKAYS